MTDDFINSLKNISNNWSIEVTPAAASKIDDFSQVLKKEIPKTRERTASPQRGHDRRQTTKIILQIHLSDHD